ncbi:hypothetical protein OOT00_06615 [Desulfobotulus sp. H1]|uniref:HD domain-containing protein n=1 Tax=Desulfobotulus pelophilus TaxID=2823377 RepID=A0ABT3N873_9BACT|nr:hypothetical protein [Desulfobotulus pelophilus]MCW7753655.1 hypothetical protein [Desulfobotulus pelophilus]
MNEEKLAAKILSQYRLNPFGTHGVSHWARVMENGLRLCLENGADQDVIRYFALFHDSCRRNEGLDFNHGLRGANLARRLRRDFIRLNDTQLELLVLACRDHTKGRTKAHITIQTCWDADRLDLGRVGKIPDPARLCTEAAKHPETIAWATERASRRIVPEWIWNAWGLKALRFNDKGLPWLDRQMVARILKRVTCGFLYRERVDMAEDKQIRDFLEMLTSMQHYNYSYRSEAIMEMKEHIMPLIPDMAHTDVIRMWLALALALKDLYHMPRSRLAAILAKGLPQPQERE